MNEPINPLAPVTNILLLIASLFCFLDAKVVQIERNAKKKHLFLSFSVCFLPLGRNQSQPPVKVKQVVLVSLEAYFGYQKRPL
jgi:hypothetical protein